MWAQIGNWLYQNAMAIFLSAIASLLISKRYYDKANRESVFMTVIFPIDVVLTFLLTIYILFAQNILYTINLIEIIPWAWLRRCIDNYTTIGVFLFVDIVIAYFIIIRNFFWKNKKYNMGEKIILAIALILYVLNVVTGIAIKIDYEISDKKAYEVIEQNRAIVSNYDGKFVVMNCEIQGETIILKRGTYSLEEMTGVSITYHKYEKVICE